MMMRRSNTIFTHSLSHSLTHSPTHIDEFFHSLYLQYHTQPYSPNPQVLQLGHLQATDGEVLDLVVIQRLHVYR